jgi:biopolymer transport protein ExbD
MAKIRRPSVSTEIPSASMADIAFLLLIFYISTTVFSSEQALTLVLPPKGEAAKRQVSRQDVMVLHTDAMNQVTIDDQPLADLDALSDRVKERLAANPKLVVSIETHPRSRYKTMIKVLDEVKEAEAPRISLKTAGAGEGRSTPSGPSPRNGRPERGAGG